MLLCPVLLLLCAPRAYAAENSISFPVQEPDYWFSVGTSSTGVDGVIDGYQLFVFDFPLQLASSAAVSYDVVVNSDTTIRLIEFSFNLDSVAIESIQSQFGSAQVYSLLGSSDVWTALPVRVTWPTETSFLVQCQLQGEPLGYNYSSKGSVAFDVSEFLSISDPKIVETLFTGDQVIGGSADFDMSEVIAAINAGNKTLSVIEDLLSSIELYIRYWFDIDSGFIFSFVSSILEMYGEIYSYLFELISDFSSEVTDHFTTLFQNLENHFHSLTSSIQGFFSDLTSDIGGFFSSLETKLEDLLDPPKDSAGDSQSKVENDSGVIGDFEDSYFGSIGDSMSDISTDVSAGVTGLAPALVFVGDLAQGVANGIDSYLIIFILPIFIGILFFILSRVPGYTRVRDGGAVAKDLDEALTPEYVPPLFSSKYRGDGYDY